MKKINVNQEACIGCGACVAIDPEHFAFNDEGLSHPISEDNLDSQELQNAISSCPTCAISMIDGEEVLEEEAIDDSNCECDNCSRCDNCSHEEA